MSHSANNAGEQLLSDVASVLYDLYPDMNVEDTKGKLSVALLKYHIQRVERDEPHPDLQDKIKLFLAAKKLEGLSPITLGSYKLDLMIFADRMRKKAIDVSAADIRIYLAEFETLKNSSISKKLSVLKSFFGWLASEEFIQRDPTTKLKPPKEEKRMPKALSIEELELLRESYTTKRQRALLEILYSTGCRLDEIHKLNQSDINYQTMSCKVIGKGNKEREVYFSFKAMYHLRKYLMNRTDDVDDALFVTERKPYRRLGHRAIQREIGKVAKELEKRVSPHTMRHTFATLTLNNGAELAAVQQLLGHESSATTQIYAHYTEERKRDQHKKFLVQ
jgi:integrase/recombinase XerD